MQKVCLAIAFTFGTAIAANLTPSGGVRAATTVCGVPQKIHMEKGINNKTRLAFQINGSFLSAIFYFKLLLYAISYTIILCVSMSLQFFPRCSTLI